MKPAARIAALCAADPGWMLGPRHDRVIAFALIEASDGRRRVAALVTKDGRPSLVEVEKLHHYHDRKGGKK